MEILLAWLHDHAYAYKELAFAHMRMHNNPTQISLYSNALDVLNWLRYFVPTSSMQVYIISTSSVATVRVARELPHTQAVPA